MDAAIDTVDLGEIDASTISRRTHEALAEAIVTGKLPPKASLSDRRLAEQLGVSRTPVRDALHLLKASGLVERRGRIGWAVTDFGIDQVRQLYELRRLFESAGLERLTEWDDDLLASFARFRQVKPPASNHEDMSTYLAADRDFHRRLVQSSGNDLLLQFHDVVELQIDRIRHFVPARDTFRIPQSFEEHMAILDALEARDVDAARAAIRTHIHAAEKAIAALL